MNVYQQIPCVVILLSVVGCFSDDGTRSQTVSTTAPPAATSDDDGIQIVDVAWDLSDLESYFKIVSPPTFDNAHQAFVMVIEADEDGNCAVSPAVPSGFFGFEATLFDKGGNELHTARDVGSAMRSPASVEAYNEKSPRRICVDPPRWRRGTEIRLMIAPGVDRAILAKFRRGKISAI